MYPASSPFRLYFSMLSQNVKREKQKNKIKITRRLVKVASMEGYTRNRFETYFYETFEDVTNRACYPVEEAKEEKEQREREKNKEDQLDK